MKKKIVLLVLTTICVLGIALISAEADSANMTVMIHYLTGETNASLSGWDACLGLGVSSGGTCNVSSASFSMIYACTGSNNIGFQSGDTITLNAVAEDGYTFTGWYEGILEGGFVTSAGTMVLSTDSIYSFAITQDQFIYAVFSSGETAASPEPIPAVTSTPSPAPASTDTPAASPTIIPAPSPAATATPASGETPSPIPTGIVTGEYSDATGQYTISENGEARYDGPAKNTSSITIPDTIPVNGQDIPVTSVRAKAFYKNSKLKTITIGQNVQTIGKQAFASCKKLTTIKGGAGIISIGDSAFASCPKLKTVPTLSRLEAIGAKAFQNCTALTKITLASKVNKIGKSAFSGCKKLQTITVKTTKLTAKTSSVGSNAFKGTPDNMTVKCPKKKLVAYQAILVKRGISKNAKFK